MGEVDPKEIRRAAKEHAAAMTSLHEALMRVSATTGTLAGKLERSIDAPLTGGELYHRAEAAIEVLNRAYTGVVAVFDDLGGQTAAKTPASPG